MEEEKYECQNDGLDAIELQRSLFAEISISNRTETKEEERKGIECIEIICESVCSVNF